ncbi:tyrosine-type recombinase/integrase [Pseudomonas sp. B21-032]|uniref:tyrosine-type recombinase/integrase n=1 Tax=Pseudomonas sp. B21-032 TaxID=2895483 RepID=UPI002160D9E9|nr:tyrosine-type recombinase/integrase [Pseudomonas sp. B21-032]UVL62559.1 tyrosine-type recombinase/integrase [Pseudomonas sp. B21-032]
MKRQLIPSHPLSDINAKEDLQIKKVAGSRSLSDEEIRLVWKAMEQSRMATKNKIFLKLCLIYGCRNGELRVSEKGHFDFKAMVWTVPPENHKLGKNSGKPLLRPIVPEVESLIRQAIDLSKGSPYLFTRFCTKKDVANTVWNKPARP